MGYMINGKDIRDIAEVISTSDPRSATNFSTTVEFKHSGKTFKRNTIRKLP